MIMRGSGKLYMSRRFKSGELFYEYIHRWQEEYDQLDEWDKFEMEVFWAVKL